MSDNGYCLVFDKKGIPIVLLLKESNAINLLCLIELCLYHRSQVLGYTVYSSAGLQIRGGVEDNSEISFLIYKLKHLL